MKLQDHCYGCLRGLVEKAVALSNGDGEVTSQAYSVIDNLWNEGRTPPEIANKLHRFIRDKTGISDPYLPIKINEVKEAQKAIQNMDTAFPKTLEGFIKLSAVGNSMDFFCNDGYKIEGFDFSGDIELTTGMLGLSGNFTANELLTGQDLKSKGSRILLNVPAGRTSVIEITE